MVNTDDFIKRLEVLLDYYTLSASSFADKIGVQRSSISHLLSGRNKPSLDFIIKIIDVFPDINVYWLINGKGNFLKNDVAPEIVKANKIENITNPIVVEKSFQENLFQEIEEKKTHVENELPIPKITTVNNVRNSEIDKIVILYKDGSFVDYSPK